MEEEKKKKPFRKPIKSLLNKNKEPLPSIPEVNREIEGNITNTVETSKDDNIQGEKQIGKEPEVDFGMSITHLTDKNAEKELLKLMSKFMPSGKETTTTSSRSNSASGKTQSSKKGKGGP